MTKKIFKYILQFYILAGIVAALINFCNMSSLWWDEAMLSVNIVNKSAGELLQPLDFKQVAPIGFLEIEKIITTFFNNTDWSLRVFPLISYLISIYLIYLLTYKIYKKNDLAFFASAIFSLSLPAIRYSSEVKQYMSDVLITLIILLFTMTIINRKNKYNLWIYALLGSVTIWFSNTSIIILFPSGLYFLYNMYREKKNYLRGALVIFSWLLSFITYYFLFIHSHPSKSMMVGFWSRQGAFLPHNIFSGDFYIALLDKMKEITILLPLFDRFYFMYIPIIIVGIVYLIRKKKGLLFLLIFPVIFHLTLSYFKLYPFKGRLILYLLPLIILLLSSGVFYIFSFLNEKKYEFLKLLIIIPLFLMTTGLKEKLPVQKEEIKKSMAYLNDNISVNDKIYVRYAAYAGFLFYKNNFRTISKISDNQITVGRGNGNDFSTYEKDILKIQGDVWILLTQYAFYKKNNGVLQKDYILNTFKKNGYKIVIKKKYKGSAVYKAIPITKEKELQQEISR